MERLLRWCTDVKVKLNANEERLNAENLFFIERVTGESSFIEIATPDDIRCNMFDNGLNIYMFYMDAVFISGKPSWDTSWRYEPKPTRVRLGFSGSHYEETLARVITWFEEHEDKEKEPAVVPYSSMKRPVLPIICRTKDIPHWND